jgi:protein-tyrosine phosphatase
MYIDIHTHLLPEIDNGLQNKERLFQIFSEYAACNVSSVVFTPHLFNPYVHTQIPSIYDTYTSCRQLAETFGIHCYLGSEIFLRDSELDIEGIPIDGRYYLIELPAMAPPSNDFLQKFDKALGMGYEIIIAHIERYSWITWDSKIFKELQARGILFQCDAANITLQKARTYLDRDLIDVFATNHHGKTADAPDKLILAYARYPSVAKKAAAIFL